MIVVVHDEAQRVDNIPLVRYNITNVASKGLGYLFGKILINNDLWKYSKNMSPTFENNKALINKCSMVYRLIHHI